MSDKRSHRRQAISWRPEALCLMALAGLCAGSGEYARPQCDLQADEVRPLIHILRDRKLQKTDPEQVKQAVARLGEMRCAAAADDLAAALTFEYRFNWEGTRIRLQPIFTSTRFPATGALAQIGEPALPALAKVIEANPPGSLMTRNATYTVKFIFREAAGRAKEYLTTAAEKATSRQSRSRLRQAVLALPKISLMDSEASGGRAPR